MGEVILASQQVDTGSVGFLMRQTLEGEALGISVLQRIHRELVLNHANSTLLDAVVRQIEDERRLMFPKKVDKSWVASVGRHIALSPVVNLKESAQSIGKIGFGIFQNMFETAVNRYCMRRHRLNQDLGPFVPIKPFSLSAFDEKYTAPQAGFSSASEYYVRCSSQQILHSITTPTVCVLSRDDEMEPLKNFPSTENFRTIITEHGGHLGFVSPFSVLRPKFWLDEIIMDILNTADQTK